MAPKRSIPGCRGDQNAEADVCRRSADANLDPERVALFHKGVTLFLQAGAERGGANPRARPGLNGCQTIKSTFLFRVDGNLKSKIKDNSWQRVAVPARIIETPDDELVRSTW